MCGICGIYYPNIELNDPSQIISKMVNAISHRGPDYNNFIFEKNHKILLGHTRLKIIDLSDDANQPMYSNDNRYVIVFNGEIYNFQEIKSLLNYNFRTKSDTEVILASIKEKGVKWFLQKANGMFAFSVYDKKNKKLYLARDRFGIKPLYYYHDNNKFLFSSETGSIFSSGIIDREIDINSFNEYLAFRYCRAPKTYFKNIFQLEPAQLITVENFKVKKEIYWKLPNEFNNEKKYDETSIFADFENELINSIKYRNISDVQLGSYLSGGVDSSLITSILRKVIKRENLKTYSIGFKENNEFNFSRIVSNKLETDHNEILISKNEYLDNWFSLIEKKNAPLGVPNEVPLFKMSEILKKDITVVLSGEGADELAGGYGRIFRSDFEFSKQEKQKNFSDFFIDKYEYLNKNLRTKILNHKSNFDLNTPDLVNSKSNLEFIFRFFYRNHIQGLLERLDFTTMSWGVEARVPFLDHKLVEFSFQKIPSDLKLLWRDESARMKALHLKPDTYSEIHDIPKYPIRFISKKYLPNTIINRKKIGFPVPLNHWQNELKSIKNDYLKNSSFFDVNEIDKQLANGSLNFQNLWMLINLEIFSKLK